jgi:amino acid permease
LEKKQDKNYFNSHSCFLGLLLLPWGILAYLVVYFANDGSDSTNSFLLALLGLVLKLVFWIYPVSYIIAITASIHLYQKRADPKLVYRSALIPVVNIFICGFPIVLCIIYSQFD